MEQIVYGIKTAGHDSPEPEKKVVTPQRDLVAVFEDFIGTDFKLFFHYFMSENGIMNEIYNRAHNAVNKIERAVGIPEVHALLQAYAYDQNAQLFGGFFVSAMYNHRVEERVITFDSGLPYKPHCLAYAFHSGKVFVNKQTIGDTARYANGVLINYGLIELIKEWYPDVKILNYGTIECGECRLFDEESQLPLLVNMGVISEGALESGRCMRVNFGNAGTFRSSGYDNNYVVEYGTYPKGEKPIILTKGKGVIICLRDASLSNRPGPCELIIDRKKSDKIPGLRQYFDEMRAELEKGRHDVDAAIKAIDSLDAATIEADLVRMIRSAGVV